MNDSKEPYTKTRVYYGEYTLRHWLDLLLSRNINLPDYQRSFVWEEPDVMRLIESLRTGQFIMPVTIAHYQDDEQSTNIILDGQQRLTSILLTFFGYMPRKEMFRASEDELAHGDDSCEEEGSSPMEWTYKRLLQEDARENTIEKIKERLREDDRYSRIKVNFDCDIEEFFDKTFLGFSFIIPDNVGTNETQRYFSTLFRNMNYLGKKLSPLESRRSLYFLNYDYRNYFDGKMENGDDVLCNIRIMENMVPRKIDLVRYLSMLSQRMVVKNQDTTKVMVGYSAYGSRESYYADYVSYIVHLEQESRKDKFDGFDMEQRFPDHVWRDRYEVVHGFLDRHKKEIGLDTKYHAFTSWIDADYWLFGLFQCVLFKGQRFNREQELVAAVNKEIEAKRALRSMPTEYQRNPNRLGNLRNRIERSIALYSRYAEQ